MKQVNKARAMLLSGLILAPAFASAELYVSPAMRGTISYGDQANPAETKGSNGLSITGKSVVHGPFQMSESRDAPTPVMGYGNNVPLFLAIESIIPAKEKWDINVDQSIINTPVSWEASGNWKKVLQAIGGQNNLFVEINDKSRTIGVALKHSFSKELSKNKNSKIWRLNKKETLRENLATWAKKGGWHLDWDKNLDFDYAIDFDAEFAGSLIGPKGVIDQLLSSFQRHETPLRAVIFKKNHVIVIKEAGYQNEGSFNK